MSNTLNIQSPRRKPINLKYVGHVTDFINLGHVTRSKVYTISRSGSADSASILKAGSSPLARAEIQNSEKDTYMFLAMRGTGTVGGGGISVYKLSDRPDKPEFILHQDVAVGQDENSLEGLDCETINTKNGEKSILATVANRVGVLHLYKITNTRGKLELKKLSSLQLKVPVNPDNDQHIALHVEIYYNHDDNDNSRKAAFAIVTCTNSSWLVAVNITDPEKPKQAGGIETGIDCIEGIYLKPKPKDEFIDYAYCGGYRSSEFKVIQLTQSGKSTNATLEMEIVNTLTAPYYNNMVSDTEQEKENTDSKHTNYLFTASWAHNRLMAQDMLNAEYGSNLKGGGVMVFDVTDPSNPQELFPNAIVPQLSFATRVKVTKDYAYMPLQMNPGKVGIVNIKDPKNIFFERSVICRYTENPFSLADYNDGKNEYLYVFGKNNTMSIMQVDFPAQTNTFDGTFGATLKGHDTPVGGTLKVSMGDDTIIDATLKGSMGDDTIIDATLKGSMGDDTLGSDSFSDVLGD